MTSLILQYWASDVYVGESRNCRDQHKLLWFPFCKIAVFAFPNDAWGIPTSFLPRLLRTAHPRASAFAIATFVQLSGLFRQVHWSVLYTFLHKRLADDVWKLLYSWFTARIVIVVVVLAFLVCAAATCACLWRPLRRLCGFW